MKEDTVVLNISFSVKVSREEAEQVIIESMIGDTVCYPEECLRALHKTYAREVLRAIKEGYNG